MLRDAFGRLQGKSYVRLCGFGIKQIRGAKETEALTLSSRSLPSKRMGQVGTTRKKWVR